MGVAFVFSGGVVGCLGVGGENEGAMMGSWGDFFFTLSVVLDRILRFSQV